MQKFSKLVIAGDGGTGKSTLIASKLTGKFCMSPRITIGVDFQVVDLGVGDDQFKLMVYDLGGQERFHFMHESYILGANASLVLYDLTREKTFEHVPKWIALLVKENPHIPIILVGSKNDLAQSEDLYHFQRAWETRKDSIPGSENVMLHATVSSKTLEGMDSIFTCLSNLFLKIPLSDNNVSPILIPN